MIERIFIFKHKDQELERVDWDIQMSDIDLIKSCLSFTRQINYDDIEMETIEIYSPVISEQMFVRSDGALMYRNNSQCSNHVIGFQPALDISHEELFHEFLDLIAKKDIDNAITFY
ncbi:MAG TPA: hypothetical protein VIJ57_10125 [Hanamia sp.]